MSPHTPWSDAKQPLGAVGMTLMGVPAVHNQKMFYH